jgi:hypothetical protein
MPRPYHIQFPDYERRMVVIKANVRAWLVVAEQLDLFELVPMQPVPQRQKEI